MSLQSLLAAWSQRVDGELDRWLTLADTPDPLREAMRYSTFNGGKRLRPVLVYASCLAVKGELAAADAAATAVECIHAYSLIHDDLPAMDDDDLRRGKPTCHIAFDEATAVLAGDALQALAFEILAADHPAPAESRLRMLQLLAQASGARGMVGGQALDMAAEGQAIDVDQLRQIQALKTGALIRSSVLLGGLSASATSPELAALGCYADALGLAFQIKDDLLDVEGSTEALGKPQGSDQARNKSTYPALLGLQGARSALREQHQLALDALQTFGSEADPLRQLADYVAQRNH